MTALPHPTTSKYRILALEHTSMLIDDSQPQRRHHQRKHHAGAHSQVRTMIANSRQRRRRPVHWRNRRCSRPPAGNRRCRSSTPHPTHQANLHKREYCSHTNANLHPKRPGQRRTQPSRRQRTQQQHERAQRKLACPKARTNHHGKQPPRRGHQGCTTKHDSCTTAPPPRLVRSATCKGAFAHRHTRKRNTPKGEQRSDQHCRHR